MSASHSPHSHTPAGGEPPAEASCAKPQAAVPPGREGPTRRGTPQAGAGAGAGTGAGAGVGAGVGGRRPRPALHIEATDGAATDGRRTPGVLTPTAEATSTHSPDGMSVTVCRLLKFATTATHWTAKRHVLRGVVLVPPSMVLQALTVTVADHNGTKEPTVICTWFPDDGAVLCAVNVVQRRNTPLAVRVRVELVATPPAPTSSAPPVLSTAKGGVRGFILGPNQPYKPQYGGEDPRYDHVHLFHKRFTPKGSGLSPIVTADGSHLPVSKLFWGLRPGSRVLLFVHGWNTGPNSAMNRIVQYAVSLRDHGGVVHGTGVFTWPSQTAYKKARKEAVRAAEHLARYLVPLCEAAHAAGCFVVVVGHSMGCRVIQLASHILAAQRGDAALPAVSTAVFMHPDVDWDDLMRVDGAARCTSIAQLCGVFRQVRVLYNLYDTAFYTKSMAYGGKSLGFGPHPDHPVYPDALKLFKTFTTFTDRLKAIFKRADDGSGLWSHGTGFYLPAPLKYVVAHVFPATTPAP